MFDLSTSEMLLYGGIAIMVVSAVLAILCMVIFKITGKRLKRKLEQEYGKPQ